MDASSLPGARPTNPEHQDLIANLLAMSVTAVGTTGILWPAGPVIALPSALICAGFAVALVSPGGRE